MVQLTCEVCHKEYFVEPYRAKISKYCSYLCHQKGIAKRPVTWGNKIAAQLKGRKCPWLITRNKTIRYAGVRSGNWKGDAVGYIALHQWVKRNFTFPDSCEKCGKTTTLHLANKDHQYTREQKDWWILCAKCHRGIDREFRKNGGIKREPHRWKKQKPRN